MSLRPEDPTPEEIAERCLEFQRTWTEQQRAKRLVPAGPYVVPTIAMSEVVASETRRIYRQ